MRIALTLVFCASAATLGCASSAHDAENTPKPGPASFLVLDRPPIIEAKDERDLSLARLQTERLDLEALQSRTTARRVGREALGYLNNSEVGREFLALPLPRAISRGSPPEACPAVAAAGGEGLATRAEAVEASLRQCLARLGPNAEFCGCRVLAVDDLLAVPRPDIAYATGTAARILVPHLGVDALVVAEDLGRGETLLRDLRGPVGIVQHGEGNEVRLALIGEGDAVFAGQSIPVGFRRGRLAERIYAEDAAGRTVTVLIGFSPQELEEGPAAAWLAAPTRG